MRRPMLLMLLVPALLAACSEASQPPASESSTPTFHRDVEPILQKSCLTCHLPGRGAPFTLASYADAKPMAASIASDTQARIMPPWGAVPTDECSPPAPMRGDLRLTLDEIATLAAWNAAGAPEGDPADAPPAYTPPNAHLSRVDMSLAPKTPYTIGSQEAYRCFVLDPALTDDVYVDGYEIVPGTPGTVHHALAFLDPDGASTAIAGPDGSYTCFGGPGFTNTSLLAAWAPGTAPFELTDDMGTKMKKGSLVVLQVHYHPTVAVQGPDSTKLDLRLHATKPSLALDNQLLGNAAGPMPNGDGLLAGPDDRNGIPEFRIPANTSGHVERMRFTLNFPIPSIGLYGAGAHMHRAGVDLKIDRIHHAADGSEQRQCLLQTPSWDFNWQRVYQYDAPLASIPQIASGDTIEIRCTYDNTLANAALAAQLAESNRKDPIDILLGESTLDEMCIGFLPLVYPNL